jgi:hypothetical protein
MWPEWTSMLGTWQWAALAAVPPLVVALYFLKLKRRPLEVPSTYLWRKSLEDLHVNSLWQRLRRSLLLWLQLLLLGLLVLALGRPSWIASQLAGGRSVFLVDNSASMAARDVSPTRLAEAKRVVGGLIDEMGPADVAMIVAFSDAAQVAQSFTGNRQQLHRALAAIGQTNRTTSLADALRVAGGLANSGRGTDDSPASDALPAKLFLVSDGRFEGVQDFALGNLDPVFIPIGKREVNNQAIVSLGANRPPTSNGSQLYARIENFSPREQVREVSLYVDGELADAEEVTIPSGQSRGVAFELETAGPATVELRLDGSDELAADDRAWKVLEAPRPANVLCITPGDEPLAFVLAAASQRARVRTKTPAYLETPEYAQAAAGDELDLVIYDRCTPKNMPQASTLFIGRLPPDGRWSAAAPVSAPQIVDINAAHPLLHLVEMNNVLVAEATPLKPPPGGTNLIDSSAGPLFAIAPRDAFEDCVLGFELVHEGQVLTNWPLKRSFPAFALNLLEYFGSRGHQRTPVDIRPGQVAVLGPASSAASLEMKTPGGRQERVIRGKDRLFRFADTDELGIYELDAGREAAARFAVNLLDAAESNLAVRGEQEVKIGHVTLSGQSNWRTGRRDAWRWLVLAALAILLLEWYIYNRRVYI